MNKQEIFDKVKNHLLTQNAQAGYPDGERDRFVCQYRAKDGKMCAVGCLINDENYHSSLEGSSLAGNYVVRNAVERSLNHLLSDEERSLLVRLQNMHDHVEPKLWAVTLDIIAKEYGVV